MTAPSAESQRAALGLFGYTSLGAFTLLADDAARSPDLAVRIRLSRMAAAEMAELAIVEEIISRQGWQSQELLAGFAPIMKDFLVRAQPGDWWERLMRSYVGFNLLEDLLGEMCEGLPVELRDALIGNVGVSGHADLVAEVLEPVLASDEKLASRLALWGRRVVGEALSLTRRLFAEFPELAELIAGDGTAAEREAALMGRLQAAHARRFTRLKLTS